MKARIIKTKEQKTQILCQNGSIKNCADQVLAKFLTQFASNTYLYELNGDDGSWREFSFDMAEYPGETLAYVSDNLQLIVFSPELFHPMVSSNYVPLETNMSGKDAINYLTIHEYAERHNRSEPMIRLLCKEGKIPGVIKKKLVWLIPEDAPYPIPPASRKK